MTNIFDIENRFFKFITKLINLILINILWVIFSMPIITMGAATSAVYYLTLKMVTNEEGYIIKSFWKAFRQNLKQGIIIEIILSVYGIILYVDIRYFLLSKSIFGYFFVSISAIGLIVCIFTFIYVFPIIAKFKNTVYGSLKNAVIMSLQNLLNSISMTLLFVVILYGVYSNVHIMDISRFIAVSGYAYVNSILLKNIFSRY